MNKNSIRKKVRECFDQLQVEDRKAAEEQINLSILNLPEYNNSKTVLLYNALPDEVDLSLIIEDAYKSGKDVAMPFTYKSAQRGLVFDAYLSGSNEKSKISKYGIKEPIPDKNRLVLPEKIDLIIVPGRAFDLNYNRVGRGGGCYDKFMSRTLCVKCAVCFSFQMVEELPVDKYDIKMDIIINENEVIRR